MQPLLYQTAAGKIGCISKTWKADSSWKSRSVLHQDWLRALYTTGLHNNILAINTPAINTVNLRYSKNTQKFKITELNTFIVKIRLFGLPQQTFYMPITGSGSILPPIYRRISFIWAINLQLYLGNVKEIRSGNFLILSDSITLFYTI